MGFYHVAQAGLKLQSLSDPPTSASDSAGANRVVNWSEKVKGLTRCFAATPDQIPSAVKATIRSNFASHVEGA
ncbi:hypothetical protein AAY473_023617 [Plecturocebus cupreus]